MQMTETQERSLCKQATIHQVTTMLATSKNVQFRGHYNLLTTFAGDRAIISVRSSVPVVVTWKEDTLHEWLAWRLPGGWLLFLHSGSYG